MTIPQDVSAQLHELLGDQPVMMLTTIAPEGFMRSRPMQLQKRDDHLADFWFATHPETHKVTDIHQHPNVNLAYYDPVGQSYVSISGRAELAENQGQIGKVWHEGMRAWFPGGPDDPKLMLLKVQPTHIEYCQPDKGALGLLWEEAKAAVSGKRPDTPPVHRLDVA